MALLDSPRLRPGDLEIWRRRAAHDRIRAQGDRLSRQVRRSLRILRDFGRPDCVSVSWGKDSVVAAHLTRQLFPSAPLCWVRWGPGWDNPEAERVRDAYLDLWPTPYVEVDATDLEDAAAWAKADREVGSRRVTGIRSDESLSRRLSAFVHGVSTTRTCRPLLWWTHRQVFAYAALHDLPLCAVYAMSLGGALDRSDLRVDVIGGPQGRPFGRKQWERVYFPDVEDVS